MAGAELIKVGCLRLTPEQFKKALDNDMTISQTLEMVRKENEAAKKRKASKKND